MGKNRNKKDKKSNKTDDKGKKKVNRNYESIKLVEAVDAVNSKRMTAYAASKYYGVPKTTINNHVTTKFCIIYLL